jgi:hypothetical protein
MSSVLFRSAPPAVDAPIDERRRTGAARFDEVWERVYVVNPPPSSPHSTVAGLVLDLPRPELPGVDLGDNAVLRDRMDAGESLAPR